MDAQRIGGLGLLYLLHIVVLIAFLGCDVDESIELNGSPVRAVAPLSGAVVIMQVGKKELLLWRPVTDSLQPIRINAIPTVASANGDSQIAFASKEKFLYLLSDSGTVLQSVPLNSFANYINFDGGYLILSQSAGAPRIFFRQDASAWAEVTFHPAIPISGSQAVAISDQYNRALFIGTAGNSPFYPRSYLFATDLSGKPIWHVQLKVGHVNSLAFSPDGESIVLGDKAGRMALLDSANGNTIWDTRNAAGFSYVSFFEKGSRIVTADFSGTVKVWNGSDGSVLIEKNLHASGYVALTIYNCHSVVSGGSDGRVMLTEIGNQCVD